MSLKAQLEAIIYAAETPITLEQITALVKESVAAEGVSDESEIKSRVRSTLVELAGEYGSQDHASFHLDDAGNADACADEAA